MELDLDAVEKRVLGSLMEKDMTTPEYYPLTLNALLAACNQKSNREPVMEVDEAAVRKALRLLAEKQLAGLAHAEGRVARFEHRMGEALNLGRRESALLCTLLLRGAQTPGELRARSERMHRLEDLDEVQLVLQKLIEHDPPLVTLLPRHPGAKEARYADLFSAAGDGDTAPATGGAAPPAAARQERIAAPEAEGAEPVALGAALLNRITALEDESSRQRAEIEALRSEFVNFRSQFEP